MSISSKYVVTKVRKLQDDFTKVKDDGQCPVFLKTNDEIKRLQNEYSALFLDYVKTSGTDNVILERLDTILCDIDALIYYRTLTGRDYFIKEFIEARKSAKISVREKKTKARKSKEKSAPTVASSTSANISSVVKNMLTSFPFNKLPVQIRSKEECMSRSTTKPYYISKEKLVQVIDEDNDLREIFGPNYKKKTKDELCSVMFGSGQH